MSGFGQFFQHAISQLPTNMQNYVGGPSVPGMAKPGAEGVPGQRTPPMPPSPGDTFQGTPQQNYGMLGPYNTMAQDMSMQRMGGWSPMSPYMYRGVGANPYYMPQTGMRLTQPIRGYGAYYRQPGSFW